MILENLGGGMHEPTLCNVSSDLQKISLMVSECNRMNSLHYSVRVLKVQILEFIPCIISKRDFGLVITAFWACNSKLLRTSVVNLPTARKTNIIEWLSKIL